MSKRTTLVLIAAALGLGGLLAGSPVAARNQPLETMSISVNAHGLDLDQPSGAAAMLTRIRRAASQVCDFKSADPPRSCIRDAVSDAVARLNDPRVTAVSHLGW